MGTDFKEEVIKYRDEINRIDKEIVDNLNERAKIVLEIKRLKKKE